MIRTVATKPFPDQRPGTSGLRKQVPVFQQPGYLENFIQSIFNSLEGFEGQTLVLGGDGRFFNREAIQIVVKIAAANGFGQHRRRPGRNSLHPGGLGADPGASHLRRHHPVGEPQSRWTAWGFGVKSDLAPGGPAAEKVTEAIFAKEQGDLGLQDFRRCRTSSIDRLRTSRSRARRSRWSTRSPSICR